MATLVLGLLPLPIAAGPLSGPVLDAGLTAELVDLIQLPPSSASPPLARVGFVCEVPDGSGRLFANDMRGPFYAIDGEAIGLYLDLSLEFPNLRSNDLQLGFVSFAFHPDFAQNGIFYTAHTEYPGAIAPNLVAALPAPVTHHAVLTEWQAEEPAADVFNGSSRELMRIAAPHSYHNLGALGFDPTLGPADPDYGLLYVACGEFGSVARGDPGQLQRLDTVYGALLRIDPLGVPFERNGIQFDYGIPASNPFAGDGDPQTFGEIFAFGFRNPENFRFDFGGSGRLIVAEIGESKLEELDLPLAGANCGWPVREGNRALDPLSDPSVVFELPPDDAQYGFTYPVAMYDHQEGRAIAGGLAVRGYPPNLLTGKFVFGDIVNGRIFYSDIAQMLAVDDGDPATNADVYQLHLLRSGVETTLLEVLRAELANSSIARTDLRFSTDNAGRLLVTTKQDGFVRLLIPEQDGVTAAVPAAELGSWLRAVPNPFRPGAEFQLELSNSEHLRLELFDLAGRRVRVLFDREWSAGRARIAWDGRDDAGRPLASGTYLGRIRSAGHEQRCKLRLIR